MSMIEMRLKVIGSDGVEILEVPFGTRHVTWAMRNGGYRGAITEAVIANYVANLIWRAGEDWKRQLDEWCRARVAARWSAERNMAEVDAEVRSELEDFLSWADQSNAEQNEKGE